MSENDATTSASSPASSSPSASQPQTPVPGEVNGQAVGTTQMQQDEQLLVDVNKVLHQIVSSSELVEGDDDGASSAGGDSSQHRKLSGPELISLRVLEVRIRKNLSQQRGAFRKTVTGDPNRRVRDHARSQAEKTGRAVRKVARKAVTGSGDRSISDWVKQANVVKTVDKASFALGVSLVCTTEYVLLKRPSDFGRYYVSIVSIMMLLRLYMYARNKWIYFLLDFCYFANASCFISVLFLPDNAWLWRLNYSVSNGVLLAAVLAWRNSLVFHSLDKVTSIAIHILPGFLTYLERWSEKNVMCSKGEAGAVVTASCTLGFMGALAEPLIFYTFWQFLYILKTEIIDRQRLQDNPSIQTSLRWLTRDSKNFMHIFALRTCRVFGVIGHDETFEPEAMKTKIVFWIGQALFIVATLFPIPLLFSSYILNSGYILFVLSATVWNGANYYFEVFAARYIQQLEASSKRGNRYDTSYEKHEANGIKEE
eukprot:CAMPEP_0113581328 /NCGR_PEP_ID=MMETSP0015_2-20120614/31223_1 /TAXON_ID=2838 /ORGANISM="Odontella" /LENGTH=481 /DNA_ID=CAMNT_0000485727 /DNA_START=138 /DNA_END=1583 /DNA_ORIENTATION=+ /assembly_acc=CAM_ASM_000160